MYTKWMAEMWPWHGASLNALHMCLPPLMIFTMPVTVIDACLITHRKSSAHRKSSSCHLKLLHDLLNVSAFLCFYCCL